MTEPVTEPAVEPEAEPVDDDQADDVEPVDDDEVEEADEAEHEHEAESEEQSSTALLKALEREENRHAKALAKALGVELHELHECPTCQAMGYTPDAIEAEPELVQDPYLEGCERCAGVGEVLTGAAKVALWKVPCSGCAGSGYVTKSEQPGIVPQGPNGAPIVVAGDRPPVLDAGDAELARELRSKGYTIVEPVVVPATSAP